MNLKAARAGSYFVAAVAASLSYVHQRELYDRNGLGPFSYVLPLAVDVLALMAAGVRATDGIPKSLKTMANWTLAIAGSGSIAANVAVAENWVQVAAGVGAVIFYLMAELFSSALAKAQTARDAEQPVATAAPASPAAIVQPAPVAVAKPVATRPAKVSSMDSARAATGQAAKTVAAILAKHPHLSTDEVATMASASTRTVRRVRAGLATAVA